ncbi:hypothetical protein BDZ45DRAFT_684217 [Acephala macrosclerotiorum]|nr:hypothetical protein BDZ45DRAFT_684217 [Acephala macrosclerotiorum]
MNRLNIALFASASVLMVATTLTLSMRAYVRICLTKGFGVDDYFTVAALAFYVMAEAFVFDAVRITREEYLRGFACDNASYEGQSDMYFGKVEPATSYAQAALVGVADLIFAILPVFVVWNLQMNIATKLSLVGLPGAGAM